MGLPELTCLQCVTAPRHSRMLFGSQVVMPNVYLYFFFIILVDVVSSMAMVKSGWLHRQSE